MRSSNFPLKYSILTLIILLGTKGIFAQNGLRAFVPEIHGFVKSDYWLDSRKIVGAREELLLLFPDKVKLDSLGNDLNATPGIGFSAITSRLNFKINGVPAFGADAEAFIEADFSGVTNTDIDGFRLRHAYLRLQWQNSTLLMGQYWHPSFVPEVFPEVIALSTGAPFQPFIRNPQIMWTPHFGNFHLLAAVIGQRDYANDGPNGRTPDYYRYALFPNIHGQIKYIKAPITAGLGADYKVLRPRISDANGILTNERVSSYSFMAYTKYKREKLSISSKAIWGQNMTEHLLLGGYAVATQDSISGIETYTPSNNLFLWANIVYGQGTRVGLFAGYAKNYGTSDPNIGIYYGRGMDMDWMYRVSGFFAWHDGPVEIATELEYTTSYYGSPDENGMVKNATGVGNFRIMLTGFYFF